MLKLTKTGIGLLTKQYRSVLNKCLLLNLGLFLFVNASYAIIGSNCIGDDGHGVCAVQVDDGNIYGGFYGGMPRYLPLNDYGLKYITYNNGNGSFIRDDSGSRMYAFTVASIFALDDALNYYYTFRVDESNEVTDSASFFQKDFSTLQEVDLQSKNPTHLGAFTKCDEVCPRPSERFSLSLSQEQMLKNDASVDAGTFSICSLQIENVNEKLSNVFDV